MHFEIDGKETAVIFQFEGLGVEFGGGSWPPTMDSAIDTIYLTVGALVVRVAEGGNAARMAYDQPHRSPPRLQCCRGAIGSQLAFAPSTYHERKAREADPERPPPRAWRDDALFAGDPACLGWEFRGMRFQQGLVSMITVMEPFRDRANGATSGSG